MINSAFKGDCKSNSRQPVYRPNNDDCYGNDNDNTKIETSTSPPSLGKPWVYDYLLCPGSREFKLCLRGWGKLSRKCQVSNETRVWMRWKSLGANHLTLRGGGGGEVCLKKNFLQALVGRKKLHAAQMK